MVKFESLAWEREGVNFWRYLNAFSGSSGYGDRRLTRRCHRARKRHLFNTTIVSKGLRTGLSKPVITMASTERIS